MEVTGQGEDGKASQSPEQQSLPSEGLFILILFLITVKIFYRPFLVLCYYEDLLDFLKKWALGSIPRLSTIVSSVSGCFEGATMEALHSRGGGGKDPKRSLYTHQLKAIKICEISSNPRPFIIFIRLYLNGLAL